MHVVGLFADVKRMYTELPHDAILRALEWLLHCSARRRTKHLCVRRAGRKGVRWGLSYDKREAACISLQQLQAIIVWALRNATFTIGNRVMRQLFGIPMGDPTSPALATLICVHCEHQFHASLGDVGFLPSMHAGIRYFDDINAYFAF